MVGTCMFVRTFQEHPQELSFVLATQSIAEIGIQIIAISQACTALELDLHLRDIRKSRNEISNEVGNQKPNGASERKRKKGINIFLWTNIAVFITIPGIMWTIDAVILKEKNYQTFDELMNDKLYMRFLFASLTIAVVINLYIVIVLSICQGRAIHGLKKHFGVVFRKETTQISRVLITFTITICKK